MKRIGLLLALVVMAGTSCASNGSSPGPGTSSGIRGQVLIGPTCPVERADSPCPDQPVAAVVIVLRRVGEAVGNVRTNASGTFFLALAPGSYLIYANEIGDNPRQSKFQPVTVRAGEVLRVELVIDTGIR